MKKEVSGPKMVLGYLGIFLVLVGIITAFPMVMMVYPGESDCAIAFLIPVLFDILVGLVLYFVFLCGRRRAKFLRHEDSFLLVAVWLFAILSGAAPMFSLACSFSLSVKSCAMSKRTIPEVGNDASTFAAGP